MQFSGVFPYPMGMISFDKFHALLSPQELETLAVPYALDKANSVKLSGSVVFLCLLNGLLNHNELSQRLLEETFHQYTGDICDHSSFSRCFARIEPTYFDDLVALLRRKLAPQLSLATERALHLRFVDATTVTLSAKLLHFGLLGGTCSAPKSRRYVKTVWEQDENGLPACLHLCKTASENADSVALGETMRQNAKAGDLFIFDKGCHGRARLLAIHDAQAFWLTPLGTHRLNGRQTVWQSDTVSFDCPPASEAASGQLISVETAVFGNDTEAATKWREMPLVLVHLWRYDQRRRQWVVLSLMTNLPYDPVTQQVGCFSFEEIAAVFAQRWDIEVFFKLLKQHLSLSHLVSRCENGIGVMLAMTQIAVLLMLWYRQQTHIDRGWRSVKFWLANDVREWTQLALAAIVWQTE